MRPGFRALLPALFSVFLLNCSAWALSPEEVLVIANRNAAASRGLALFYMEKRQIPKKNLVLLWVTDKETCTREEYDTKIVPPVRRFLEANPVIRAMVTVYGVPLRVLGPELSAGEAQRLEALTTAKETLEAELDQARNASDEDRASLKKKISQADRALGQFKRSLDRTASVDSELSLVRAKGYDLKMWQPNPFYLGFRDQTPGVLKSEVTMTSRLDGASEQVVKRIITDSMEAETEGLKGTACFDARWKDPGDKKVSGYAFYDKSIHAAARHHEEKKILPVVLNDTQDLFQPGDCPDAALYCGWYRLANYVDAFTWTKGSVGFHIASSECATLKNETSNVWCKKMLDKGIAATVGPVGEPYVQAFPVPELFFQLLTEGYLTLAESYFVSLPYLSWKMVLVGDPLYRVNIQR